MPENRSRGFSSATKPFTAATSCEDFDTTATDLAMRLYRLYDSIALFRLCVKVFFVFLLGRMTNFTGDKVLRLLILIVFVNFYQKP